MSGTKVELLLPCKLTPEEKAELHREMAEVLAGLAEAEEQRDLLEKQIQKLRARAAILKQKHRSGTDWRHVEVRERPVWRRRVMVQVRADTGRRVGERPMAAGDRQLDLVPEGGNERARAEDPPKRKRARARARTANLTRRCPDGAGKSGRTRGCGGRGPGPSGAAAAGCGRYRAPSPPGAPAV